MGIDKFHSWLKTNYSKSIEYKQLEDCSHLYLDLNFMIHRFITYVSSEDILIDKVITEIIYYIELYKPTKTVNLAADGAANYAKVLIQKKRRINMSESKSELNTLMVTTGTNFMNKFNEKIIEFIHKKFYEDITFHYNLSNKFGESEFKLCRMLRRNYSKSKNNSKNNSEKHLLFCNDADVILIMLSQIHINNIYILTKFPGGNGYTISIDKLSQIFYKKYGNIPTKRYDFTLISIMLGNDYFPKLKYVSFDSLWGTYYDTVSSELSIVDESCNINLKLLSRFLGNLSMKLPKQFHKSYSLGELYSKDIKQYLVGLQWCLKMYENGKYNYPQYLYSGQSLHPTCIHLHIDINKLFDIQPILPKDFYDDFDADFIPSEIYPALVMPYASKELVPEKYHDVIENKLKYMYDEELCTACTKLKSHKDEHNIKHPKKYLDDIIKCLKNVN